MKVLYLGIAHDYGDPLAGPSYEEANIHDSLRRTEHEIHHFDFVAELLESGYHAMNDRLWNLVQEMKPDVLFCVMFEDQIDPRVIARISNETAATTIAWFADDHWRFDRYSCYWAPRFNWAVTTWRDAVAGYLRAGQKNVIASQWGFNPHLYRPSTSSSKHEISFVGRPHSGRRKIIARLRREGFDVEVWGPGWERGPLSLEEMVDVFATSRINLNFSAWSTGERAFLARREPRQIKGRVFEVTGSGGLLLTEAADGLDGLYEPDTEIVVYEGWKELVSKIDYLLSHEDQRRSIAARGFERAVKDHTWESRFNELFATIAAEQ